MKFHRITGVIEYGNSMFVRVPLNNEQVEQTTVTRWAYRWLKLYWGMCFSMGTILNQNQQLWKLIHRERVPVLSSIFFWIPWFPVIRWHLIASGNTVYTYTLCICIVLPEDFVYLYVCINVCVSLCYICLMPSVFANMMNQSSSDFYRLWLYNDLSIRPTKHIHSLNIVLWFIIFQIFVFQNTALD